MRIAVFGVGYVGSVTAACLAREGHTVIGVDPDERKVARIRAGRSPVVERDLDELIAEVRGLGRLDATTDAREAVRLADVSLVCVGTPSMSNGDLNLRYAERVASDIGGALAGQNRCHVVVFRSTMLPGSVEGRLAPILASASGMRVGEELGIAMCPEFLRESTGVADFYDPPFTVCGVGDERTTNTVRELFAFIDAPFHRVDVPTAEALKYACNAFHGIKVAFANEMGRFCQASGGDARALMRIFCADDRLNLSAYYLRPGFSFGGSCLPKDLRAAVHRARRLDLELPLLSATLASNAAHLRSAVEWVLFSGVRTATLLGLSFKVGTDDLRDSPYVELAETLIGKGVALCVYDANVNPLRLSGTNRAYVDEHLPHLSKLLHADPHSALSGVECAIVASDGPLVVDALLANPPPRILDLNGRLGPQVEALPGYAGIAW